jgi:hypothetical protein
MVKIITFLLFLMIFMNVSSYGSGKKFWILTDPDPKKLL